MKYKNRYKKLTYHAHMFYKGTEAEIHKHPTNSSQRDRVSGCEKRT